jgi:hydrogenase 3 maturation protease
LSDRVLQQVLCTKGNESTIYITLGNQLRSDDGVGPYIAERVAETSGIIIRDAGNRPERALDWALDLQPDRVVFIDAADFGAHPGEIRVLSVETLNKNTFSTHRLPLPIIMEWITHETGARCSCIGIQLCSTILGHGLSILVQRAADQLIDCLSGNDNYIETAFQYHTDSKDLTS